MTPKKITAGLLAAAALILIYVNYSRIIYANDTIRGILSGLSEKFIPRKQIPHVRKKTGRLPYKKTYRPMHRSFIRLDSVLLFKPDEDTGMRDLARHVIELTDHYSSSALASVIKNANSPVGDTIRADETVLVAETLPSQVPDPGNRIMPVVPFTRGLYFSGGSAGSGKFIEKIPALKQAGINTVVFDVKDVGGIVNYRSDLKLVKKYGTHDKRPIENPAGLIRELKKNGIYIIARVSVFHDQLLAKKDPSLAIRSSRTGGIWRGASNEVWCDPTNKTVQDYNIAIACEIAEKGADEIQFDYIRFPTTGNFSDAVFAYSYGRMGRDETIANFLKKARAEISARNCRLSIDIFGVVAWGKQVDIMSTGQRIEMLASHCDAISPMLYPSHFSNDFDGYARPGDNPYYFINAGCRKVTALAGKKAAVRPWLQAFKWRVSSYNEKYILDQIRGSDEAGAYGYLFWNASNDYGVVLRALRKKSN